MQVFSNKTHLVRFGEVYVMLGESPHLKGILRDLAGAVQWAERGP